jgi:hypothetical protein
MVPAPVFADLFLANAQLDACGAGGFQGEHRDVVSLLRTLTY